MPSFNSVGLNSVNQSPKKIQGIHFFIYNQKIIKKIYKLIYFSRSRCSFEHPHHNIESSLGPTLHISCHCHQCKDSSILFFFFLTRDSSILNSNKYRWFPFFFFFWKTKTHTPKGEGNVVLIQRYTTIPLKSHCNF